MSRTFERLRFRLLDGSEHGAEVYDLLVIVEPDGSLFLDDGEGGGGLRLRAEDVLDMANLAAFPQ